MTDPERLPSAENVSHEHLTRPAPPSHEFRFGIRALLILMFAVAIVAGLIGAAVRLAS